MRLPLAAALLLLAPALAAAEPLPAKNEALLLLRVLAFDRELTTFRARDAVVVVVASRHGDAAGEARRAELVAALREAAREFTVKKLPVRVVPLDWGADAAARLKASGGAAVLVVGSLGEAPAEVAAATREAQLLSFAESREAVAGGLSVALVVRGAKAGLHLSIMHAQREGAAFEAPLLRQAEVLEYPTSVP